MKKVLIIISIIILVGVGFWYFNRGTTQPTTPTDTTGGSRSFFPFGTSKTNVDDTTNGETNTIGQTQNGEGATKQKLNQITTFAVAGVTTLLDSRTTPNKDTDIAPTTDLVPAVRYVERATGHIYEQYLDTGVVGKISDSSVLGIHEAIFGNDGRSVIYRYLSNDDQTIESFLGTLGGDKGSFLPENISAITTSPDGSQFFYLMPFGGDTAGNIQPFSGSGKNQIFTSSFTEWLPEWGGSVIFLTTKPSANVTGYLYASKAETGGFSKVFGGILGLTTKTNEAGTQILYSNNNLDLGIYDLTNKNFNKLGFQTISDKCVWSNDNINIYCGIPQNVGKGAYPESWYQGQVSFSDHIVKINTQTGNGIDMVDTTEVGGLDATYLILDKAESKIFFINKKDSTLWSLDL